MKYGWGTKREKSSVARCSYIFPPLPAPFFCHSVKVRSPGNQAKKNSPRKKYPTEVMVRRRWFLYQCRLKVMPLAWAAYETDLLMWKNNYDAKGNQEATKQPDIIVLKVHHVICI